MFKKIILLQRWLFALDLQSQSSLPDAAEDECFSSCSLSCEFRTFARKTGKHRAIGFHKHNYIILDATNGLIIFEIQEPFVWSSLRDLWALHFILNGGSHWTKILWCGRSRGSTHCPATAWKARYPLLRWDLFLEVTFVWFSIILIVFLWFRMSHQGFHKFHADSFASGSSMQISCNNFSLLPRLEGADIAEERKRIHVLWQKIRRMQNAGCSITCFMNLRNSSCLDCRFGVRTSQKLVSASHETCNSKPRGKHMIPLTTDRNARSYIYSRYTASWEILHLYQLNSTFKDFGPIWLTFASTWVLMECNGIPCRESMEVLQVDPEHLSAFTLPEEAETELSPCSMFHWKNSCWNPEGK